MSKELKETMLKEVKGGTMTMSHQVENFNKEIEMIKKKNKWKFWNGKLYNKHNEKFTGRVQQ